MKWLINWLKKIKEEKVQRAAAMLESGEYDRKIKQEEILAKAREKENKIKKIKNKHRLKIEDSYSETPNKRKEFKIGL